VVVLIRALSWLPAALVLAAGTEAAAPGSIRGRVQLLREPSAVAPRPSVTELGMPRTPETADRRQSVVYLETAPLRAFEEHGPAQARLDQRNETFVPYVLPITVGTTVAFSNSDRTYHNVFSLSKPRRFDLGRYGTGRSKSVRFDHPGVVRIFCDIHSHMSAFILVFAHRFFAVTDPEGRYRIEGVPPGTYTLVAWNDGQERATRTVQVSEGEASEVDFVVR
jgi:plastocyanin